MRVFLAACLALSIAQGAVTDEPLRRVLSLEEALQYLPAAQDGMEWRIDCSTEQDCHMMAGCTAVARCEFREQKKRQEMAGSAWMNAQEVAELLDVPLTPTTIANETLDISGACFAIMPPHPLPGDWCEDGWILEGRRDCETVYECRGTGPQSGEVWSDRKGKL